MPNPNPPSLLDAARAAVGKIECQRTPPSTDPECACPGCVAYRALRAAWNAAVEASAEKAEEQKFRGVPTIAREIRKLKAEDGV